MTYQLIQDAGELLTILHRKFGFRRMVIEIIILPTPVDLGKYLVYVF